MLRLTSRLARNARTTTIAQRGFASGFLDNKDVTDRVITVVGAYDLVDNDKVTATSHFVDDLGLDSLDAVEVVLAIEEEFCIDIPDMEAEKILSVEDAINFICAHPQAK